MSDIEQDAVASATELLLAFPAQPGRSHYRTLTKVMERLGYRETREFCLYGMVQARSEYDPEFDYFGLDVIEMDEIDDLPEPYRSFQGHNQFTLLIHPSTEKPLILAKQLILLPDAPDAVDALWVCVVDLAIKIETGKSGHWPMWIDDGRAGYYNNLPDTIMTEDNCTAQEILESIRARLKNDVKHD